MLTILFSFSLSSTQFAADFVFRTHHRDGWNGTNTKYDGHSGIALLLTDSIVSDLDKFFQKNRKEPEIVVVPLQYATSSILNKIQTIYKPKPFLQGFVILANDDADISPGVPFPNKAYSCYQTNDTFQWNPKADSLQNQKFDVPVIYPSHSTTEQIYEHIRQNGEKAGFYLNNFMISKGNDVSCLSEGNCKPIGGISMYGSFTNNYNSSSIWAITSFDTYGLIPYGSTGSDYSISGFVTLLAAIELFQGVNWSEAKHQLKFAFFEGEENGYLGSEKFVTDITNFKCQVGTSGSNTCREPPRSDMGFLDVFLDNISAIVEIRQDATSSNLYAHSMPSSHNFVDTEVLPNQDHILVANRSLPGIPPSSTHTFLKRNPNMKHVVLTGFRGQYPTDNRYGSPSDVLYDAVLIANHSLSLARTLAKLCGVTLVKDEVNVSLINEIMGLFVTNISAAPYVNEVIMSKQGATLPTDHISLYGGVFNGYTLSLKHVFVREYLKEIIAYNVTDINCSTNNDCANWSMECAPRKNVCVSAQFNYHPAYSNAYEYKVSSGKFEVVNNSDALPRMTEADWKTTDFQMTMFSTSRTGRVTVGIGILLWIGLSVLFSFCWNRSFVELVNNK
ncbi:nicastrin [Histomonas meleagridis]|uniref:nicastrin n=1 Tax=Histomonas meleagridis TaxID=135588 RepID=UPI003559D193|nr:nicastrin [Histomonas meleagridis]KAH0806717.1 nicastrin [Histomonas meleagridis]